MRDFTLDIEVRSEKGSAAIRRFRRDGKIPAVAYGRGMQSVAGLVSQKDFVQLAQHAKGSQIWKLKSALGELNQRMALVRDVQREFIGGRVLHVDFLVLNEKEEVTLNIPLKIVGEAPGVKAENGVLSVMAHEVSVMCLPRHIPQIIEVDISGLHLSQSIHAAALPMPEGVKLAGDGEATIVSVVIPRSAKVDEEAAAAPAEGAAAAAPADGEKAAAEKTEKK